MVRTFVKVGAIVVCLHTTAGVGCIDVVGIEVGTYLLYRLEVLLARDAMSVVRKQEEIAGMRRAWGQ